MEDQDFQSPDILVSLSWSDLWCWSYCQLSNLPIMFASDSLSGEYVSSLDPQFAWTKNGRWNTRSEHLSCSARESAK